MRRCGLWGVTISRRARRGASGVPATGSEVFAREGLSRSGPNAGLALSDAFRIYGAQKHTDKLNPENWTKKDLEEAVALVERLFGCCDRSRGSHGPHAMRLMMPPIARCGRGVVGLWGGAVSEYAFRTMLGSQVMKPRPAADLSLKRPDPIEVSSERRNPQSGSHIFRPYYPVVVEV